MTTTKKFLGLALSLAILLPAIARPCTTFCLKIGDSFVFGRNYDWEVENAYVIINKRNMAKTALLQGPGTPVRWASKYGSVTFNQYGRELPLGGMNEAGLVIELMELRQGEYPLADQRPAITDLQWIQYQLDTAETVAEVIANDRAVRIDSTSGNPVHFLVCDRKGGVAAIEFLSGRMQVHTGKDLPVAALTNNTYAYGLDLLNLYGGAETHPAFVQANYSLKRFVWAAQGVRRWTDHPTGSPVDYAFRLLDKVAVDRTMFRIVYDGASGTIYFRTKSIPEIRRLESRRLDYSCKTPVQYLDILEPLTGDVTSQFKPYRWEANYDLIKKSFAATAFLKKTPDERLRQIAQYPDTLSCREK